jgi:hypothetical protein
LALKIESKQAARYSTAGPNHAVICEEKLFIAFVAPRSIAGHPTVIGMGSIWRQDALGDEIVNRRGTM